MILAVALLAASTAAFAGDSTATVSVQSDNVYRGQVLSEDVSAGLGLRFDNVVVDGLFVTGDFSTLTLSPANDTITVRSDFGAGYKFGTSLPVTVSVNRVLNPVLYSADYTEARASVGFGKAYAEIGHGLTADVNRDTYIALGYQTKLGERLTLGGKVSAFHYDGNAENRFNNTELTATYNIWRNLDASVTYSHGGSDLTGGEIDNRLFGGFGYRF